MFTIQPKIKHRSQETAYSCGAAAIAMLFGAEEKLIRKEVKTKSTGTPSEGVLEFLDRVGLRGIEVRIEQSYFQSIDDLMTLSYKFPIYVCETWLWKNVGVGRPVKGVHAVLIADGMIYDPAQDREMIGEEYIKTFNKGLTFNYIIIIDQERPNFLKNSRERY